MLLTAPGSRELLHEIATPAAVLDAALLLLELDPLDASALAAARKASSMLSDLLLRHRGGVTVLHVGPVDLAEVASSVVAMLAPLVDGVELRCDAAESVLASADPNAVAQVLVNLVVNAVKYAPGSPVLVSARRADETVVVSVCDQGPGIPEQHRRRILEPGVRLVEHSLLPGDGLGLAISLRLAEAMGATLEITEAEPSGSCVTLRIPAL